jgi:hypothetical protein
MAHMRASRHEMIGGYLAMAPRSLWVVYIDAIIGY